MFKPSQELRIGDRLVDSDRGPVTVVGLRRRTADLTTVTCLVGRQEESSDCEQDWQVELADPVPDKSDGQATPDKASPRHRLVSYHIAMPLPDMAQRLNDLAADGWSVLSMIETAAGRRDFLLIHY